jgi:hypothetical protein
MPANPDRLAHADVPPLRSRPFAVALGVGFGLTIGAPVIASALEQSLLEGENAFIVRADIPPGWQEGPGARNLLRLFSPNDGGQIFWVGAGGQVRILLEPGQFAALDLSHVQSWRGDIAGHPARYLLTSPLSGLRVEGLPGSISGSVLVALLDQCIGTDAIPVAVTYASQNRFEAFEIPEAYIALTAGLAVNLPEDMRPCTVDLAEPMQLIAPTTVEDDGWIRRERLGVSIALPGEYDWSSWNEGLFRARVERVEHPSVTPPGSYNAFNVQARFVSDRTNPMTGVARSDVARTDMVPRELGPAGNFDVFRLRYNHAVDGAVDIVVLLAQTPSTDGLYTVLSLEAYGMPEVLSTSLQQAVLDRLRGADMP